MKKIIAIDLGGTNFKIALVGEGYRIAARNVLSTKSFRGTEDLIRAFSDSISALCREHNLKKSDIRGVGMGLPGPIDAQRGIVHLLPNIPGFKEVKLKVILEKKLGMPIVLDNDAKLMALAESRLGAARGLQNVLCLTLGTGVGGGLILDGKLYRGADNASAELGHVPINESGPLCNCGGRACLESYIGNARIIRQAQGIFKRTISLEELSVLAARKNPQALGVWTMVGRRLGIALSGVVNLLNLDAIVIGGGVANAGRILFDEVRRTICERAMCVQARRVKVFKAKLGSDAGLIGGALLVEMMI